MWPKDWAALTPEATMTIVLLANASVIERAHNAQLYRWVNGEPGSFSTFSYLLTMTW